MSVPASYLAVVLIWSTTPLAIQWSGDGVGFEFGVFMRMLVGLCALLLIVRLRRLAMPWDTHARRVYLAGGISLYVAMSCVYWSAQYIPSGWLSVIFGLSPLFTSILAVLILGNGAITGGRLFGLMLGLAGLSIMFAESFSLSSAALLGVAGVTLSAFSQSLGAVLLQKLKPGMPAVSITAGSLIVALPLFALNCFIGAGWPDVIPSRTLLAIVYLALFGTSIGFPLYFYLLKHISAERVALIALITPVLALLLGSALNDEVISSRVWLGTACVLCGLAWYEYGKYLPLKKPWRVRWKQRPM